MQMTIDTALDVTRLVIEDKSESLTHLVALESPKYDTYFQETLKT